MQHDPDDDGMVLVFRALADPTRRHLLDLLHQENGQTVTELHRHVAITRQGMTQHLAVLESAGLISTVRRGREKLHYLNPVPIHAIYDRWIAKFERPNLEALGRLKHDLEQETHAMTSTMTKPTLVHVIYIDAPQERVWKALTDPEQTATYWGHRNVSGWAVGDSWRHQCLEDASSACSVGTIEAVDPPHRLVHSWGDPGDVDKPGRRSRVTFDLSTHGGYTRLSVTHEDVPADQMDDFNGGWAIVLSSLKSFLETGKPLTSLLGGQPVAEAEAAVR